MSKRKLLFAVFISVALSLGHVFAMNTESESESTPKNLSVQNPTSTNDVAQATDLNLAVFNAGFEEVEKEQSFAKGWRVDIGGGAKATVTLDSTTAHSGKHSIKFTNESPMKSMVFASCHSKSIDVQPDTTYVAWFYAKGKNNKLSHIAVVFENGAERRLILPNNFDWRKIGCQFTTPKGCKKVVIRFTSENITEELWIDDVSLERLDIQLANLKEPSYPKEFDGYFPRTDGPLPDQLIVCNMNDYFSKDPAGYNLGFTINCLQGIVNRTKPRIYLYNWNNSEKYYDEVWLEYIKSKGYTGSEEVVSDPRELIRRFRKEITGVIIYDANLPGSLHAARMLAGLKNALPVSPKALKYLEDLNLPVVMDLRGKWKRNVDAYEFIYENYWDQMNHHVLNWMYPLAGAQAVSDYLVAFNVFSFWVSGYHDDIKGADPVAEEQFLNKLLANTPGNVPIMGWPNYADHTGVQEYTAMRLVSGYGKFFPGTEYCSNLTVHSAIRPDKTIFRQKFRDKPSGVELEKDKIYISVNIIDSGDAVWYQQFYQRKIWADPVRGTVPMGFCMNPQMFDLIPAVAQWYYENATPNEEIFSYIYLNSETYGTRFCQKDQDRIWAEYVQLTEDYCKKMDLGGIEIYNGGWGTKTPPTPQTFPRFVDAIENLDYILADFGRHEMITPKTANYMLGNTPIFHTLTRFEIWSNSEEAQRNDMDVANKWLINEIISNSPTERPGFMSGMAVSWYYFPTWMKNLQEKLPDNYVLVTPHDLARLFRQHKSEQKKQN